MNAHKITNEQHRGELEGLGGEEKGAGKQQRDVQDSMLGDPKVLVAAMNACSLITTWLVAVLG